MISQYFFNKNTTKAQDEKGLSRGFVACDLILYLLLLKEKEDDCGSYGP